MLPLPSQPKSTFSKRVDKSLRSTIRAKPLFSAQKQKSSKKLMIFTIFSVSCVVASLAFLKPKEQAMCPVPIKEVVYIDKEIVVTTTPIIVYVTVTPIPTPRSSKKKTVYKCCSLTSLQYFSNLENVRNYRLDQEFARRLDMYAQAMFSQTGEKLFVDGLFRTYNDQVKVKKAKGRLAASPGHSNHEFGRAADVNAEQIKKAEKLGIDLSDFGLWLPMGDPKRKETGQIFEDWHVEKSSGKTVDVGVDILYD